MKNPRLSSELIYIWDPAVSSSGSQMKMGSVKRFFFYSCFLYQCLESVEARSPSLDLFFSTSFIVFPKLGLRPGSLPQTLCLSFYSLFFLTFNSPFQSLAATIKKYRPVVNRRKRLETKVK